MAENNPFRSSGSHTMKALADLLNDLHAENDAGQGSSSPPTTSTTTDYRDSGEFGDLKDLLKLDWETSPLAASSSSFPFSPNSGFDDNFEDVLTSPTCTAAAFEDVFPASSMSADVFSPQAQTQSEPQTTNEDIKDDSDTDRPDPVPSPSPSTHTASRYQQHTFQAPSKLVSPLEIQSLPVSEVVAAWPSIYRDTIDRALVGGELEGQEDGTFLVRPSQQFEDCQALCVMYGGIVLHYLIER